MNRLVIDTDPGVDDAHAIMMAFAHPEAQIEAITTVSGGASLERATANACTILDVLEQDAPVYAGCGRALLARTSDASFVMGKDGLGDSGYPPSKRRVADEHAVHALVRMANASPGEFNADNDWPTHQPGAGYPARPDAAPKVQAPDCDGRIDSRCGQHNSRC